jgi:hypothetical protein
VKTTLEIPDPLLRQAKAAAAQRGESLREFVSDALRSRLNRRPGGAPSAPGWTKVFGKAPKGATAEVDAILEAEFEQIDSADWK